MRTLLFINVILINVFVSYGQDNQDFGLWFGADAQKEINDNFVVKGDLALRTDDNSSHIKQSFYQIGITHKGIIKGFKTSLAYRNRFINDYKKSVINNRLIWDVNYKIKISPLSIQFRNRIQNTFGNNQSRVYNRFRLKAKIKLENNVKAFVSTEFFNALNNVKGQSYRGQRWSLGATFKINDMASFSLAYIRHTDKTGYAPLKMNIIDLGLSLDF